MTACLSLMYTGFMRNILFTLLCLWSIPLAAGETSDPFNTEAMLPPRPALHPDDAAGNPCSTPPANRALSLREVINLALCNNPQTREAWANSRIQAALVGVSKAGYLPSVNLGASIERNRTGGSPATDQRSIGLSLSYLLYDFGSREANLENSRQLFFAASATQNSVMQTVFLEAVQIYYQAQAALAGLDAALESERAAKESFAAAEARYLAGSATPADKLQARTAYSQATLNRITANGNLKNSQGALANMVGLDANRTVLLDSAGATVIPDDFEGDIGALIEEARRLRPDLLAVAAQLRAAKASADAARAAGGPSISLNASSSQNSSAGISSNTNRVGVTLSMPLFTGYATTYRIRAAEAQIDARNTQLERLRLQVALDVWVAYQNLITTTQSLRSTADLLDSAEQSERVALGRYKAGVGSMLDVLNAQSALASARQQRIQSTFNWNIDRAMLAQAMGNLDSGLLQHLQDAEKKQPRENQLQKKPS